MPAADSTAEQARNPLEAFASFSATLNGGIARDTDRKIYRSGKLMRLDFADHYRIVDLEKLTTRFVYPHECRTIGFPDAGSYPFSAYHGFKVERAPSDNKEVVDDHPARIDNVTLTSISKDNEPITIKMKLWEAEDLNGFPLQAEIEVGQNRKFTVRYTKVSLARPDPTLFRSPAGCDAGTEEGWKSARPNKDSEAKAPANHGVLRPAGETGKQEK